MDQPKPDTKRAPTAVPAYVYALVAALLAVACAYLVWRDVENRAVIQNLESEKQRIQDQYEKLNGPSKQVTTALTELAAHAANEADLHSSQGNRKQALADIEQAQGLLSLAKKLTTCGCQTREMDPINAQLTKLAKKLQPTSEESVAPEPSTTAASPPPGPPLVKEIPKPHPEQPEVSGENNSGGEPDA